MPHKLKSGQINFENESHPGAFACVVIKDGEFYNLTSELRQQLVKKLQGHDCNKKPEPSLEDMF